MMMPQVSNSGKGLVSSSPVPSRPALKAGIHLPSSPSKVTASDVKNGRLSPSPVCVSHKKGLLQLVSVAASTSEVASEAASPAPSPGASGLPDIELDSLRVLEWPDVCKQVASFCGTVMAAQRLAQGQLPVGRSQAESELLLQQTSEAMLLDLRVSRFFDMGPVLDAAADGLCLNPKQLQGVANTLQTALQLRSVVCQAADLGSSQSDAPVMKYPALVPLTAGIEAEEEQTLRALQLCVQAGSVSDQASKELADVRARRQANMESLRKLVDDQARALAQRGASDGRLVTLMRGRFCVGIKAGRQGDLPRKSVKLGASQTGATQVASRTQSIRTMQDSVVQLDIVAARAQHAKWMGATRPCFAATPPSLTTGHSSNPYSSHESNGSSHSGDLGGHASSLIWVPGALHPLLLAGSLPPTPNPPSPDDNRFDRNFAEPPAWEARQSVLGDDNTGKKGAGRGRRPHELDMRVPKDKQIIAITGPNTGGKTVALKTAGLMVVMAKAGLFLPVDAKQVRFACTASCRQCADVLFIPNQAKAGLFLPVDAKQVLDAAGPHSLVLLDEVGSGTDPAEGAALARAILAHLADKALMTMATTHHAELKRLADEDKRYMNVSLGFDTDTLQPTYQLLWGAAGSSNALDIARTLGFDGAVLREAEVIARTTMDAEASRSARMAATAKSLVKQLEESHLEVEEVRAEREHLEAKQVELMEHLKSTEVVMQRLKQSPRVILEQRNKLQEAVNAALEAYKAKKGTLADVKARLRELEAIIPERVAKYKKQPVLGEDAPRSGDTVFVPSYNENGTVLSVSGDQAYVQLQGGLGLAGALMGGKQKERGIKVPISSVKITKRAVHSAPAAALGA
ncbi:muts domain V-domain-containing protein [Dunaliella salina]|uniref:Muts domain V-domain-containing protein n=1 Tax=Dunaliella salina TaxID=3046 RepID=A0ABQ7H1Z2_DUNSA|nr:muts domain V-domain-containing protein [Dunaliella salina]|eukprot:KAF5840879.1 muts domain V-domain-containing protein [Dunaliella salina]